MAWALKKCRLFLSGLPSFHVITDHKPLIPILNSKTLDEVENPRLQRLKMKMGEIGSFVATWVPGSQHKAADALSRRPHQRGTAADECGEDSTTQPLQNIVVAELQASRTDLRLEEVKEATSSDPEMQLLVDTIAAGFPASRADVAEPVRKYWPVHDRLTVDGVGDASWCLHLCGDRR